MTLTDEQRAELEAVHDAADRCVEVQEDRLRFRCSVCGGEDPDGTGECVDCWFEAEVDYERRSDR